MRGLMSTLLLAGLATQAGAVETTFKPTPAEMVRLPDYCQARFTPNTSPEFQRWNKVFGRTYQDIHHYCAGLNYLTRYWSAVRKQDKNYILERAEAQFDYMIRADRPGYPLRGEIYTYRAEVYSLQGRLGDATRDLYTALDVAPTYTRAYFKLISLFSENKQRDKALEIATRGLRHIPDSTTLQKNYLELGGKLPYPEPAIAAADPVATGVDGAPPRDDDSTSPGIVGDPVPPPSAPELVTPKIGSPSNPYCRFCAE